jgi:hypothetical protein
MIAGGSHALVREPVAQDNEWREIDFGNQPRATTHSN